MQADVLLGVAEMERESMLERQAAGIAAAKERGIYTGRQAGGINQGEARSGSRTATEGAVG